MTSETYRQKFIAAGGCLLLIDHPDEFLATHMAAGRSPSETARLTRHVMPWDFDRFVAAVRNEPFDVGLFGGAK